MGKGLNSPWNGNLNRAGHTLGKEISHCVIKNVCKVPPRRFGELLMAGREGKEGNNLFVLIKTKRESVDRSVHLSRRLEK